MTIKNKLYFSLCFALTILFITSIISNQVEATVKVPLRTQKNNSPESTVVLESSTNCKELISYFEKVHNIPEKLLLAIATVESKKSPWAVNALGKSRFFSNKDAAIQYIQKLRSKGVKNINIGCMQINFESHGRKFKNVGDILTPYNNIAYAAKLMKILRVQYGSWEEAVKYYHSSSSVYNTTYKHKVLSAWAHTKGESYQAPANENISWNNTTTLTGSSSIDTLTKQPIIKIIFGPGAGVSKYHFKK